MYKDACISDFLFYDISLRIYMENNLNMKSYFDNTKSEPSKIEIVIYIGTESKYVTLCWISYCMTIT